MSGNSQVTSAVQSHLDKITSSTASPQTQQSGVVFCAIDRSGKELVSCVSGNAGIETKGKPLSLDSVFWIASCTKMIGGIAAMQLVEQGKLSLDDSKSLYKLCPELEKVKVLEEEEPEGSGKFKLVEKRSEITLRMLLAHTAGFSYSFFNEKLKRYSMPVGYDEFALDTEEMLSMPLVHHPGEKWEYGINIDWAGLAVERASGISLSDYFTKHIFEPLGIKDISFFPSKEMKENLVHLHQRWPDGGLRERDPLIRNALNVQSEEQKKKLFNSAGAGCFAKPREYCKIIAALLNDGVSPTTGNRILKEQTVQEMFTNQIPLFPNFGRQGIPDAKKDLTNPLPNLYAQPGDPDQGWGLTFMLTIEEGLTGRGRNTGFWAGLPNLFWWADREKGVGGMIASQVLPFGDPGVMSTWVACEKAVYDGLQGETKL